MKRQVTARLEEHRRRHPHAATVQSQVSQPALPGIPVGTRHTHGNRVADSVAARFARTVSYRDFLQNEAEAATRQAEAAAEVARRNAEAIAEAQQRLLQDIEHWNRSVETADTAVLAAASAADHRMAEAVAMPEAAPEKAQPVDLEPADMAVPALAVTFADQPDVAMMVAEQHVAEPHVAPPEIVIACAAASLPRFVEPPEPTTGLPTNLIEFPRQLVAARKARPRIAEGPLREEADAAPERAQLRIFEVEADAFSTVPAIAAAESVLPEWSSIRLGSSQVPHETAQPDSQVSLALPLHTAPVSQRCMAAAVDGCCIATAFLLAVAAAAYASPELPEGRFALGAATGVLLLLGVLYLLLFFTFAEATPGMRYARIGLCTFHDDNPTRKAMRQRLFAMALAAVPLGLGFAWAFLDDDGLGWHDRISRMYQRAY